MTTSAPVIKEVFIPDEVPAPRQVPVERPETETAAEPVKPH